MSTSEHLAPAELDAALSALGETLEYRGHAYELVLVGGANLALRGIIARSTKDGDLVGQRLESGHVVKLEQMPEPLTEAVADVATTLGLADDWLNLGPDSLLDLGLPPGFETRLAPRRYGSLTIWLAGRFDMICFKLYAAADGWPSPGRHMADLRALQPDPDEIAQAATWCRTHDPSPGFASLLDATIAGLTGDAEDGR